MAWLQIGNKPAFQARISFQQILDLELIFLANDILLQSATNTLYVGQVMELRLSCYLVLLSIDSKTR